MSASNAAVEAAEAALQKDLLKIDNQVQKAAQTAELSGAAQQSNQDDIDTIRQNHGLDGGGQSIPAGAVELGTFAGIVPPE